MLGTLNGALEAREINLLPDDITADVEGINEVRDGLPVLTRIVVRYTLRIPAGSRETVDRALARHGSKCPTAASLAGAVEVEWEAQISETVEG
jgi:organic hydroperoxide reductase OsmC/OhrA